MPINIAYDFIYNNAWEAKKKRCAKLLLTHRLFYYLLALNKLPVTAPFIILRVSSNCFKRRFTS